MDKKSHFIEKPYGNNAPRFYLNNLVSFKHGSIFFYFKFKYHYKAQNNTEMLLKTMLLLRFGY